MHLMRSDKIRYNKDLISNFIQIKKRLKEEKRGEIVFLLVCLYGLFDGKFCHRFVLFFAIGGGIILMGYGKICHTK